MSGRLKAAWLLAIALIRTLLRRLFTPSRGAGIAAFRANYDADGLPPVSPDQRDKMRDFGGCIACGLCDRGEADRIAGADGAYRGVMSLVLAASRSMPDFKAAAIGFAHVPSSVLSEKERICPAGVPIREIAEFVSEKAGSARPSLPPPPARPERELGASPE